MNKNKWVATALAWCFSALMVYGCVMIGVSIADDLTEGPTGVSFYGVLLALVLGVSVYGLCLTVFDNLTLDYQDYGQASFWLGVIAAVCVLMVPFYTVLQGGHERVLAYQKGAPELQSYLQVNFARLDRCAEPVDSGILLESDLEACLDKSPLYPFEVRLLKEAQEQFKLLGHVLRIDESIVPISIATGNGGIMVMPMESDTKVYGISLSDLDGYQSRVAALLRRW
ncbi:MAG TPA: hypothetical protein PKN86_00350 [Candidatus Obscuribacter sp.]|nr:hypothetical protein [Candidatus Obscuribacter sp.]HMX46454.1 hypothetical protein [Candidatus Obscuribacter sp.]HMY02629.1 hypothetical protein [Candidatus Obscuribacter sp.]HMY52017.1 hypothetical protein [Candidatus Obscuribacter sp.]HNA71913.1 hypothetical protein [Candidatus Obscuribacter sp.]